MKSSDTWIGQEMSIEDRNSFLLAKGHGVLSMGKDNRGYGVPISYGYDTVDNRFLMEFLNIGNSKKQQFASETEEVTLTIHNFEDSETWESVIVTGTLHQINAAEIPERAVSQLFTQADDAAEEVRWAGSEDLDRHLFEIRPAEITGRYSGELLHKRD